MTTDNNPTTRRYPRTAGEAFRGVDYADPIEHVPTRWMRFREAILDHSLAVAIGVSLALSVLFYL